MVPPGERVVVYVVKKTLTGWWDKAQYADIDEEFYQWLLEQQQNGNRVSEKSLRREALRPHAE